MDNKTIKELAVELTVEITAICDEIFKREDQTTLYESRAIIYLPRPQSGIIDYSKAALDSVFMRDCRTILQSEAIQKLIRKEYPDVEYTLSLETIDETEVCAVIATGENPEYLEEICNMATELFGEKIADLMGCSYKVVEYAGPAQEKGYTGQ